VITATGSSTAFEAAYLVIQRELGDAEANRVRELVGSQSEDAPAPEEHRGRRILRRRTG
jgi:hypothetical protein